MAADAGPAAMKTGTAARCRRDRSTGGFLRIANQAETARSQCAAASVNSLRRSPSPIAGGRALQYCRSQRRADCSGLPITRCQRYGSVCSRAPHRRLDRRDDTKGRRRAVFALSLSTPRLSAAVELWPSALRRGDARAFRRRRARGRRRRSLRCDRRKCRTWRGNRCGDRRGRRGNPPRHGAQFRCLLLTVRCDYGPARRARTGETGMSRTVCAVLLALCLGLCVTRPALCQTAVPPAPASPHAQPTPASPAPTSSPAASRSARSEAQVAPGRWNVERVRCSDLLEASDADRAAAAMFYYGYLAAKAGIHIIDVGRIDGIVAKVMRQCAATPSATVPQAFRVALRPRPAHG